jgi:UDP-N-acetylmuramate dehydrogenase
MPADITELKQKFPNINLKEHESLAKYTYTETGGPADMLAFPKNVAEVQTLVDAARVAGWPLTVLGNASNLIVRDGGIRGLVLILTDMHQLTFSDNTLVAQAGAKIIDTSAAACDAGLSGLEFAAGIPGSIGGAMFMNAGAYDGEMSNVVQSMTLLMPDGTVQTLSGAALHFSYRHSVVQENQGIVLAATFALTPGDKTQIRARMDELNALRAAKQPLEYPSCGSVFKRPKGHFTGKLIHDAGLQGYTVGGVQVSQKHAGFMVNINHGTATDYVNLIQHVQQVVKAKFDVELETEVRIIGEK